MTQYRYSLEKYKGQSTKYDCPACGEKKKFSRYIDTETGQYVDSFVGRCDREVHCGYHYTPAQYFKASPQDMERQAKTDSLNTRKVIPQRKTLITIPLHYVKQSLTPSVQNGFIDYLVRLFGQETTAALRDRYFIGSSSHWAGASVFWFIDRDESVRAGQVKLFDMKGHTVKEHTTWFHYTVKGNHSDLQWLEGYKENEVKVSCMFGEHLLNKSPGKVVAIVEAPATAIVASVYLPQYLWLAVGSLSYLTQDRFRALAGRMVILFPDLGAYEKWKAKAIEVTGAIRISVSDYLEKHSTSDEKEKGFDLRDFLVRFSPAGFNKQSSLKPACHGSGVCDRLIEPHTPSVKIVGTEDNCVGSVGNVPPEKDFSYQEEIFFSDWKNDKSLSEDYEYQYIREEDDE